MSSRARPDKDTLQMLINLILGNSFGPQVSFFCQIKPERFDQFPSLCGFLPSLLLSQLVSLNFSLFCDIFYWGMLELTKAMENCGFDLNMFYLLTALLGLAQVSD